MAQMRPKSFDFEVDKDSDVPLWVQLRNRIAFLITSKYYLSGEQLPTVRALATELSINYNTVNKAYLALKSDGYVETVRGKGAFVRDLEIEVDKEYSQAVVTAIDECIAACRDLGLSLDDIAKCMDAKIMQIRQEEDDNKDPLPLGGRIVAIDVSGSSFRNKVMGK